jgi:ribosome recycling factor
MFMDDYEGNLKNAVNHAVGEFNNVRAGRVNPSIVERVTVDYYGTITILRDLATITNEDSRTILVSPWDIAIRPAVCGALAGANLGANPIDNGQYIRMIFPQLTEERRRELVKQVKNITEQTRIIMRNERRDVIAEIRKCAKTEKLGEDDIKSIETDVQKLLDNYIANLENFLAKKEVEIMEV